MPHKYNKFTTTNQPEPDPYQVYDKNTHIKFMTTNQPE